uniref:Uncharacterized protein n=1 Tax=Romanomermis culicivorax TaxID=13658 RepID=A0A915KMG0_ROMCU
MAAPPRWTMRALPSWTVQQCRESETQLSAKHNPGISEHRDDNDILIRKEQIQKFTSQILESE